MVMMRPERPAVGLPLEPALSDPTRPQLARRRRTARELGPGPISVVEQQVHEIGVTGVVVEERHEHVAGVPSNDEVLRLWKEPQPVGGEMALDEATMTLRLDDCRSVRSAPKNLASIHGDMSLRDAERPGSEHEGGKDPLRPRGTGLVGGRDEDVVVTGHEPVPTCAVEMMVAILAGAFRCPHVHGRES